MLPDKGVGEKRSILASSDFSGNAQPFVIETDACKVSEGSILFQNQYGVKRIIAYVSRSFPKLNKLGAML